MRCDFFSQLVTFWVAFGSCLNSTGPPAGTVSPGMLDWMEEQDASLHKALWMKGSEAIWMELLSRYPATWFNDHGSMILSYTPGVEMRQHAASMILSSGLANSLGKIFPSFVELRLGYEIVCFKKFFSLIGRHGLSTLAVKIWPCHRNGYHACHTNQPYGNGCLIVRFRNHLWPLSVPIWYVLFFESETGKKQLIEHFSKDGANSKSCSVAFEEKLF